MDKRVEALFRDLSEMAVETSKVKSETARILLKADVSEVGEGWSDSRIAEALDTSIAKILRP